MRERKDVYKLPPGDETLEWYAKAIAEMKTRPSSDPTSWAYQGAIHGFGLDPGQRIYWDQYAPYPEGREVRGFWRQCQHQSWFFLPWHRMYLAFFEQIVLQTIIDLGGPSDWALPYWNYSDTTNPDRLKIPQKFTSPAEPSNALWLTGRVNQVDAGSTVLTNLGIDFFTTEDGHVGFGGEETPFSHGGGWSFGGLESLPHNPIHVDIEGAMIDPDTAGLDPIFWLHHANVDRLWQVWLNEGNENTDAPEWLNFAFNFHDKNKETQSLTPRDVIDTTTLLDGYTYQGVPAEPSVAESALLTESRSMRKSVKKTRLPIEVIGATEEEHVLAENGGSLKVQLAPSSAKRSRVQSLFESAGEPEKKKMFLRFENVKGNAAVPVLSVYINTTKADGTKEKHPVGTLALFGLKQASNADQHSSGSGISTQLEVTDLVHKLRSNENWKEDELDVTIEPKNSNKKIVPVSVGRVSLYSE